MEMEFLGFLVSLIGLSISAVTLIYLTLTLSEQVKINKSQLQLAQLENKRYRRSILPKFKFDILESKNFTRDEDDQLSDDYSLTCLYHTALNIKIEFIGEFCSSDIQNLKTVHPKIEPDQKISFYVSYKILNATGANFKINVSFEDIDMVHYIQSFEFSIINNHFKDSIPKLVN